MKQAPHGNIDDEINLSAVLRIIKRRAKSIALITTSSTVIVAGILLMMPSIYTARSTLLPPGQQPSAAAALLGGLSGIASLGGGSSLFKNPTDQWVGILKSDAVADKVIAESDLDKVYDTKFRSDTRRKLANNVTISTTKEGFLSIEVDDEEPQRAAKIGQSYIAALDNLSKSLALTDATKKRMFFEQQVKQTREKLDAASLAIQGSGISENVLRTSPEASLAELAQLRAQKLELEAKRAVLSGYLTPASPDLKAVDAELASVNRALDSMKRADKSSSTTEAYIAKYRDFRYQESLFEALSKQLELARVDEAQTTSLVQVLDKPAPPDKKSKPQRALLTAVFLLFALFTSSLFYVFKDSQKGASSF